VSSSEIEGKLLLKVQVHALKTRGCTLVEGAIKPPAGRKLNMGYKIEQGTYPSMFVGQTPERITTALRLSYIRCLVLTVSKLMLHATQRALGRFYEGGAGIAPVRRPSVLCNLFAHKRHGFHLV
jgi:hypothetical protein